MVETLLPSDTQPKAEGADHPLQMGVIMETFLLPALIVLLVVGMEEVPQVLMAMGVMVVVNQIAKEVMG
jgi:hypothetical protein